MSTIHEPTGSTPRSGPDTGNEPEPDGRHEQEPDETARAATLLADLNSSEGGALRLPRDLRGLVSWSDPRESIKASHAIGVTDGRSPQYDNANSIGSGKLTTPHQLGVTAAVELPLDGLAAHGERVRTATDDELGRVQPEYQPVRRSVWLVLVILAVLGAAGWVEYAIGQQQWERVVGGRPEVATRIALGVVVMFGALSWVGAVTWIHRRPGVLREHGVKLSVVGATIMMLFAAAMAYAFANGVEAPTTAGASGGATAGVPTAAEETDIEWIRWAIYLLMTALYVWAVISSHLWKATAEDRRRVEVHVPIRLAAERASVVDPVGLLRLRAAALRSICHAWHEGVTRAASILTAYYAGVRSTLPPDLYTGWDHTSVSDPQFNEPAWLTRLREAADQLEARAAHQENQIHSARPGELPGPFDVDGRG